MAIYHWHFGQVFQNRWWMIWLGIYVEWLVVWLSIRTVFSWRQIKVHIQHVHSRMVNFYGVSKSTWFEDGYNILPCPICLFVGQNLDSGSILPVESDEIDTSIPKRCKRRYSIYKPTSSHTSASSYDAIMTSKSDPSSLIQVVPPWNRRDLLAYMVISLPIGLIFTIVSAHVKALISVSTVIDG